MRPQVTGYYNKVMGSNKQFLDKPVTRWYKLYRSLWWFWVIFKSITDAPEIRIEKLKWAKDILFDFFLTYSHEDVRGRSEK